MDKITRNKLRELAEKAKPLTAQNCVVFGKRQITQKHEWIAIKDEGGIEVSTFAFIAEATPKRITELLDSYERLVEALKAITETPAMHVASVDCDGCVHEFIASKALKDVGEG